MPAIFMAATGLGFTDYVALALFSSVSLLFSACGVCSVRQIRVGHSPQGLLVAIIPLIAVLALATTLLPHQIVTVSLTKPGRVVPAFTLATLDGQKIHSSDFRGPIVVLSFWATWCAPCRAEMPKLVELYSRYRTNARVAFCAVDTGWPGDTPEKAAAFLAQKGWDLPCAFSGQRTNLALGIFSIPKLIILDGEGRIRLIHGRYNEGEPIVASLSKEIDQLLGK